MGSTIVMGLIERFKALGFKVVFVPVSMAAGQKARCSSLDPFSEVPYVVEEEDGDFKLPDSNLKYEKPKVPVILKAANVLWSTAHPDLVALSRIEQPVGGLGHLVWPAEVVPNLCSSCVSTVYPGVDSPSKGMGVKSFVVVDSLQPHEKVIGLGKYMGVESYELVDKYMGVKSLVVVDGLQAHVKAKCCRIGLSKCMGVDGFECTCVDVHACYKGTLPWLAPRGPRISKLSRTDTAAAAPAPSRPFSFRASLTLSLSVFFE